MSFDADANPALLQVKTDSRPLLPGEDPARSQTAAEANRLRAILVAARTAVILQDQGMTPLPMPDTGLGHLGLSGGRLQAQEPGRAARSVLRYYDPRDYGADGTGDQTKATANTAGIVAAIAALLAETRRVAPNVEGTLQSGSEAALCLEGVYPVNGPIAVQPGMTILGAGAILHGLDPTQDILTTFGYGVTLIQGLRFRGGRRQVALATNSVSDCLVILAQTEHIGPGDMAVHLGVGCDSTSLALLGCHLGLGTTTGMTGGAVRAMTGDYVLVRDCYVTAGCPGDVFQVGDAADPNDPGSGGLLHLTGLSGSPGAGGGPWVRLYSGQLRACSSRFGGENGGRVVLENHSAYARVSFAGCQLYAPPPGPWARLHRMPAHLAVDETCEIGQYNQLWLDPAMPAADRRGIGNTQRLVLPRTALNGLVSSLLETGAGADGDAVARAVTCLEVGLPRQRPTLGDLLRTIPSTYDYGLDTSKVGSTTDTTVADPWGNALGGVQATADDAAFYTQYRTALAGLAAGQYTVVSEVQVAAAPARVELRGADLYKGLILEPGTHLLALPVYLDASTNLTTVGVSFTNLRNGGIVRLGPLRVYAGRPFVDAIAAVVLAPAPPDGSAGAQQFLLGDTILNPTPAPAGLDRWRCTTAGWVAPVWVTLTTYHVNDLVSRVGNVYLCTTAGQSAGGPTGQGTGITDGSAVWKFLAAQAIFKGAAALAA